MYVHKVQYYETDQMGVVHHSNYLRWMEEARIDLFEKLGLSYKKVEDDGFNCPVVSINATYKKPTMFSDSIVIDVKIKELTPVKLIFSYTMTKNNEVVFIGESTHCFYKANSRLINLKKEKPEVYNVLEGYSNQ